MPLIVIVCKSPSSSRTSERVILLIWSTDTTPSLTPEGSPVTSTPVAAPNISKRIMFILEPTQILFWVIVPSADVLDSLGRSGIVIVLDKDPPPQPNDVAVITTDPEKPSSQVTKPVTESIVPALSLFHDHVTKSLELKSVVSPLCAGQPGKVKGSKVISVGGSRSG